MGAQPTRLKTAAETQLAEHFAGLGAVSPGQADAFKRFDAQGLPHRRVEAYHFTDLRAGLRECLAPAAKPDSAAIRAAHLRLGGFAAVSRQWRWRWRLAWWLAVVI